MLAGTIPAEDRKPFSGRRKKKKRTTRAVPLRSSRTCLGGILVSISSSYPPHPQTVQMVGRTAECSLLKSQSRSRLRFDKIPRPLRRPPAEETHPHQRRPSQIREPRQWVGCRREPDPPNPRSDRSGSSDRPGSPPSRREAPPRRLDRCAPQGPAAHVQAHPPCGNGSPFWIAANLPNYLQPQQPPTEETIPPKAIVL
jgi:hypothetical protein